MGGPLTLSSALHDMFVCPFVLCVGVPMSRIGISYGTI